MAITLSDDNPRIRDFLTTHSIGILATADDSGVPHAATIYFAIDPDFSIYFMTKERTQKNYNLQNNPHAALAVYDAKSQSTVQIQGDVTRVTDQERLRQIYERILGITRTSSDGEKPPVDKLDAGDYVAYSLQPNTLKMAEFVKAEHPPVGELFDVIAIGDNSLDG